MLQKVLYFYFAVSPVSIYIGGANSHSLIHINRLRMQNTSNKEERFLCYL
jgi:hypothetical protein